jgi:glycerol-3-phosphate acyltransferase PlsY
MNWPQSALALSAAYLLGSLPVGCVVVWVARRIDIRAIGSGHTGGTNVLRVAGALPAVLTVLGDLAKGYGAVALAQHLAPDLALTAALAGLIAVVGHNWSVFLGFRGGVGTMTTSGAALALMPVGIVAVSVIALVIIAARRYSSLGSLAVAAMLPMADLVGILLGAWPAYTLIFTLGTSAMATWALRANIARLRAGTERRIGQTVSPGRSVETPRC